MAKHKQANAHHLYVGVAGLVALVALVSAVAFGLSKAQHMDTGGHTYTDSTTGGTTYTDTGGTTGGTTSTYQDPATMCATSGGTWNASTTFCQMPTTATTTDPAADCTRMGGTWNSSASPPCQFAGSATTCPSGQYFDSVTHVCTSATMPSTTTTCPSGQYPDPVTHVCVPFTATPPPTTAQQCALDQYFDFSTNTCKSTTGMQPMPVCAAGQQPTATAPCRFEGPMQPGFPFPEMGQFPPGQFCGPPPICQFGIKPQTTSTPSAPGTCPVFECNTQPDWFTGKMQPQRPVMPWMHGMEGEDHEGEFQCPPGNVLCEKFAGTHDFSDYQFNFEDVQEDQEKFQQQFESDPRRLAQESKRFKQNAKQLKKEVKQINQQIKKVGKRAGIYCPAVTDYQAVVSTIESAIAQWESAKTAEEIAAGAALDQQIYGSPDDLASGVMRKLHGHVDEEGEFVSGLDQKIGECEAAGFAFRELERTIEEAIKARAKAEKKGVSEDLIKESEDWIAKAEALIANPPADFFDPPNYFEECGGFGPPGFGPPGFGPPMGPMPFGGGRFEGFGPQEEDMERMQEFMKGGKFGGFQMNANSELVAQRGFPDFGFEGEDEEDFEPSEEELACMPGHARHMSKLMREFGILTRKIHVFFEGARVCSEIDNMLEQADEMKDKIPEDIYEESLELLNEGAASCEEGDSDSAKEALFRMQRIGERIEFEEGEEEFEFGLDMDALVQQITDQVEKKFQNQLDELLQKLDEKTKLIVALDEQISSLFAKLASFGLEAGTKNQLAQFVKAPETVKDAILDPIDEIVKVADGVEELPDNFEKVVKPIVEDFINDVIEASPPPEVAESLAKELDSILTAIKSADDTKEAKAIINEYVEDVSKVLEDIKPEERIEANQTEFTDVAENWEDHAGQYYFAFLAEAGDKDIIKGTVDGEAQPAKQMNGAEALQMLANALNIEPVEDATSVPGVSLGGATWVAPVAAAIDQELKEDGTSLKEVLEGHDLDDSISRTDYAELTYYIADLEPPPASAIAEVKADSTIGTANTSEVTAIAALQEAGIMQGQQVNGEFVFNGDATLLKIEGAVGVLRTEDYLHTAVTPE